MDFLADMRTEPIVEAIVIAAALIMLLVTALYRIFKKRYTMIPTMEFYAPEGLNPAEIGYIIDGYITLEDMTSLIYYWASHKHLSITMTGQDTFTLKRLSDLDSEHSDYEKQLFDDMWYLGARNAHKRSYSVIPDEDNFRLTGRGRTVTSEDLSVGIRSAVNKAYRRMRSGFDRSQRRLTDKTRDRIATRLPTIAGTLAMLLPLMQIINIVGFANFIIAVSLSFAVASFLWLRIVLEDFPFDSALAAVLLFVIPFCALLLIILVPQMAEKGESISFLPSIISLLYFLVSGLFEKGYVYRRVNEKKSARFKAAAWIIGLLCTAGYALSFLTTNMSPWSAALMGATVLLCAALSPRVRALTEYGTQLLSRCIGFRQFLLTAEKSRLEMLLEENPNYYYDVLPYAQVLGVSAAWLEKTGHIETDIPGWFSDAYGSSNKITRAMMNGLDAIAGLVSRKKKKKQ